MMQIFKIIKSVSYLSFVLLLFVSAKAQEKQVLLPENFDNLSHKNQVQKLSELCWQNREKNTNLALEFGLQGINMAESANYKEELAKLYGYVGVIYQHYKNQTQKAIPFYNKSLKLSLETKDSIQLGYVYNNLGDAFYHLGNVPLAMENAEKSMAIFKKINNTRGIAYSYINLGYVNRINQGYQTALHYFRNAIEIRKTFNDSIGIASATLEVGRTFYEMEKYDTAMFYFTKSLDLHRKLDNKNYMAHSYHGMADVFFQRNNYDSAQVYYQKSLQLNELRENQSEIISNFLAIARVYGKIGKTEEGENLLEQAGKQAQKLDNPNIILDVYKTRARFFQELKQFQKASENYQKYIETYDSLFSELQLQTMEEVKNRFQITEELNQINTDLEKKKDTIFYLLIITLLLVTIALVLIMRYRIKVKLSAKLLESNQTKDKILSIVSHDLLSPFNGLLGFSEMLKDNLDENNIEEAKSNAALIYGSSLKALELTQNMLNWARAQRNKIHPSKINFDITGVMYEVKTLADKQAKAKNINISIMAKKPETIAADQNLIKTVLLNLVTNAIKFTPEGGTVELSAQRNEDEIRIGIKDNGIGIATDNIKKLFKENESVQMPGTNNEKGTGLGLLVCKEFVELHGGKIWVISERGKGTVFYFTLQA